MNEVHESEPVLAWHFLSEGDKLRNGEDAPDDGVTLHHDGGLDLCRSGLHASRRLSDACRYSPGGSLCRVEVWGYVEESENDKLVGTYRRIVRRWTPEEYLPALVAWAEECAEKAKGYASGPRREYQEVRDELETLLIGRLGVEDE